MTEQEQEAIKEAALDAMMYGTGFLMFTVEHNKVVVKHIDPLTVRIAAPVVVEFAE